MEDIDKRKQKGYTIPMIVSEEERRIGVKVKDVRIKAVPVDIINLAEEVACRTGAWKKDVYSYGIMLLARKCGIKIPTFKNKGRIMATVKKGLKKELYEK